MSVGREQREREVPATLIALPLASRELPEEISADDFELRECRDL